MVVGFAVPVMKNFKGYTRLMQSVNYQVFPMVYNNWDVNNGVAVAWNHFLTWGAEMNLDTLIVSNDDVVCSPDAIRILVSDLPDYDLLSPAMHESAGGWIDEENTDFACWAVRPREFIDKFGLFDENFRPAYFEDNDMHYRIKVAGGRFGVDQDAYMKHYGSVTQFWDGNEEGRVVSHAQFESNRNYYVAKWGGTPTNEAYDLPFNGAGNMSIKDC